MIPSHIDEKDDAANLGVAGWASTCCRQGIDSPMSILPRIPYPQRVPLTDSLAFVLAGGRGSRLGGLTARRAKPALPIAGKYRLIDFALSNCLNSGVQHLCVPTQYMEDSLIPHLNAWNSATRDCEFSIRALAAREPGGYLGTADAVYQNRDIIRTLSPSYVLVLAADHVYKMDYARMLADHLRYGAEVTVGCVEVSLDEAREFGVMEVDPDFRIRSFVEKPQAPQAMPGRTHAALASMGIYIFNTGFLLKLLMDDARRLASSHDFGKDIIPAAVASGDACAYRFCDPIQKGRPAYWRDVGTVDAYWRTNIELTGTMAALGFDEQTWPIRTIGIPSAVAETGRWPGGSARPATSRISDANIKASPSCGSVFFPDVKVGIGSIIEDSVVLPGATIGDHCIIRRAVIDEGCHVPAGTRIGIDQDHDRIRYQVSPKGVVLVTPGSVSEPNVIAPMFDLGLCESKVAAELPYEEQEI